MSIIDFIIIFILAFATSIGFFFGLIRVAGTILSIIVSVIIAGLFFESLALVLRPYLLDNTNLSKIAAFILIYWFVSLFLSLIVHIVNKLFSLPVLKTVNRLMGGIVALLGSLTVLSLFFYLFSKYSWVDAINTLLNQSVLVQYLVPAGKFLSFVIPGL